MFVSGRFWRTAAIRINRSLALARLTCSSSQQPVFGVGCPAHTWRPSLWFRSVKGLPAATNPNKGRAVLFPEGLDRVACPAWRGRSPPVSRRLVARCVRLGCLPVDVSPRPYRAGRGPGSAPAGPDTCRRPARAIFVCGHVFSLAPARVFPARVFYAPANVY